MGNVRNPAIITSTYSCYHLVNIYGTRDRVVMVLLRKVEKPTDWPSKVSGNPQDTALVAFQVDQDLLRAELPTTIYIMNYKRLDWDNNHAPLQTPTVSQTARSMRL